MTPQPTPERSAATSWKRRVILPSASRASATSESRGIGMRCPRRSSTVFHVPSNSTSVRSTVGFGSDTRALTW